MDAGSKMIHLPASAVRMIGSTQVITSVYSVIKELLENSLDAGATSIDVKLENYGLDKIEVRDNGCGIKAADIPVFAQRHYTSKISSHTDLETLTTYGFRGEALASLCSVSEVSVTTKTAEDEVSLMYTLSNEGHIVSTIPSHLGQGTTVCAKGLFKNLPVRKQYHGAVKKKKDDLKNVENLLLAYGLILPKVRFSLRHNKELVWQKVALDSTAAVLQSILGKGVTGQMEWKRKELQDLEMKLELCVPKPGSDVSSLSRSTPDRSFLSVNSRPVMVKEIDKLIRQYYSNCHACDMSRRPMYYLGITLPSKDVDVNIDPNKTTVMATNMNIVREQLEELLLYIYGPLDEAPSWRYQDADGGKDKASSSKTTDSTSGDLTERLKKIHGDQSKSSSDQSKSSSDQSQSSSDQSKGSAESNNNVRERRNEPASEEPVVIFHELTSNDRQNNHSAHDNGGNTVPEDQRREDKDASEIPGDKEKDATDVLTDHDTSHVRNGQTVTNNKLQSAQEKDRSEMVQSFDLDSSAVDELLCTFPSDKPADSNESSVKKAAQSHNLCTATTSLDNNSASSDQNKTALAVDQCGDDPKESTSVEVKVTTEGEVGSRSSRDDAAAGPSGWSHGTSIKAGDGAVVQPVRLLAPSPAHIPGKRPLSPDQQLQKQSAPPEKRGRRLCPAQSTLYDMINNTAVKRPLSARDVFMKEKRALVVDQNPEADYDEVTDILATMWDELSEEMSVAFREKCWNDQQRYNKEVAAAKNVVEKAKASVGGKSKPQTSVRDMVAAASTQPSPKPTLKRKATRFTTETEIPFAMDLLKSSLGQTLQCSGQVNFSEPKVLANLPSCKAWVCGRGGELSILNIHRLSEAIVYQRLVNQHRLSVHHCQSVRLTESNTGGYWSVLEKLAESNTSLDTFTHLSDCRMTANGFDVKCWKDADGKLCAELVGVCGDVPTYNVKDLVEVLQLISNSSAASLAQCRPLKVINYLKGEAVRMVRQQAGERSVEDVQDLLEEGVSFLPSDCTTCLHNRPFFHTLLSDIDSATVSQTSQESLMEMGEESSVCNDSAGRQDCSGIADRVEREGGGSGLRDDVDLDQVMSLDDLMESD